MAILDTSTITKAVENMLKQNLSGYLISRNERKNVDPNKCNITKGWIGIYSDSDEYEAYVIGSRPWKVTPSVLINTQVTDMRSGAKCEEKLKEAIHDIVAVLEADRTLDGTVAYIMGYSITYEYNDTQEIYYYGANIRVKCETRA